MHRYARRICPVNARGWQAHFEFVLYGHNAAGVPHQIINPLPVLLRPHLSSHGDDSVVNFDVDIALIEF
jgi:hypothetical protein